MCASPIVTSESSQSRSATWSDGSQPTDPLPASPATTQGQNTRAVSLCATVIGADHVEPKSRETAILTLLGSGWLPPHESSLVSSTGLSSQTAYTLSALSSAIAGQCANCVVSAILCAVNAASPRFQVPTPMPL